MFKPGVYDIPFEEYTKIEAVSNTALQKMRVPARYKHWLDTREDEPTEAMRIGRIAHRAILEPDKFEAEFAALYAVKPDGMKFSTKEGKEWRQEQSDLGREILTFDQAEFVSGAAKAIAAHPLASAMLGSGQAEQSIVADYNGIPIKARVDWLTKGDSIVDLKTTVSADPKDFYWQKIIGLRYYQQAAFYLDACNAVGLPMKFFTILAIEKESPYLISCHQITDELIQRGRDEYVRLLGQFVECKRSNVWPGYPPTLHPAPLPENYNRVPDPAWMKEPLAA
jgi:hypothetical protein